MHHMMHLRAQLFHTSTLPLHKIDGQEPFFICDGYTPSLDEFPSDSAERGEEPAEIDS